MKVVNFDKVLPHLPGRLGNPASTLETDPRLDPRIRQALLASGGMAPGVPEIDGSASYDEALAYCAAFEAASAETHPMMRAIMPAFESVSTRTEVIRGSDGSEIKLYIHTPDNRTHPVPCIVHTHGGGMVMLTAADPGFERLRNDLANAGCVAIGVEFRNGGGSLGNHPFPAGLEDCAAAVRWVDARREELGISKIVISGESGGGNLSIATNLYLRRQGEKDVVDGVYAMCPYISGAYADPPAELVSLLENDGYMIACDQMAALVKVYDPKGEHQDNPLAWPLLVGSAELEGSVPHFVSVNELDPLRDEGLAFYRKLQAAGVSACARTVNGTPHAGDQMFPDITPEIYRETVRSISGFAASL